MSDGAPPGDREVGRFRARLRAPPAAGCSPALRDRLLERQRHGRRSRVCAAAAADMRRQHETRTSRYLISSCPVIRSMKTSSSEAATGRTLTIATPARSSAALDRAGGASGLAGPHADVRAIAERLHVDARRPRATARRPADAPRPRSPRATDRRADPAGRRARRARAGAPRAAARHGAQRSASSRYGVAMTIVRPRERNSDSSFQNSRRDTGSTPVVGSSSSRRRGSCTSVQASASFCFMPPDSRSARRSRNGVSCVISSSRSRAARVAPDAVDLGEERDVLVDGEIAVEAEALRQVADIAR